MPVTAVVERSSGSKVVLLGVLECLEPEEDDIDLADLAGIICRRRMCDEVAAG